MTDRPILFSAPMVRALLAGTKTQTRRVVKITQRTPGLAMCLEPKVGEPRPRTAAELCPYGAPGDRLWVRETWHSVDGAHAFYRADYAHDPAGDREHGITWRPSIHMPRWASRITLEVTGVRVERLQDISHADAQAEGISEFIGGWWCEHDDADQFAGETPRDGYRSLWERINGAGSWDSNPWVWVIEFRRAA